jgi:hypothetical protein
VSVFEDVAGVHEVGDDAERGAFGDAERRGDLPQPHPGVLGDAQQRLAAFVSLSTWETREQADAATTNAASWVKTNSQDRFALRQNNIGDLAIDITAAKTADLAR